jgi:peptidoglycan-N-acetylglucosamine deacetylase
MHRGHDGVPAVEGAGSMLRRWLVAFGVLLTATLLGAGVGIVPAVAELPPGVVTDRLQAGQELLRGQQLASANGQYRLVMQGDGNVVLYGPSGARWASRTVGSGANRLVMQGDGNLVAYTASGRAVWNSSTAGSGADRLVVQSDGNAVLARPDGRVVWATGTAVPTTTNTLSAGQRLRAGQQLVSVNGGFRFVVQGDGNIVLYGRGGALWSTSTFVPGTSLVMQGDGNLVAYAPDGRVMWHSRTARSGAVRLVMQDDGNAVLYRTDGRAVWGTGTVRALPLGLRGKDLTVLPTSSRVVALTFDAGGNAAGLSSILATLADRGVRATFFLTGRWAEANAAAVADIRARGHRVGNHSMTHPAFTSLTDAAMRAEVLDAERVIRRGGADPRGLFRFPFGDRDAHSIDVVNGLGYVPVRWTVDTLGWQGTSGGITAQQVVDRALGALRPGEIVLMHVGSHPTDGSSLDAAALPTMIDRMRSAGYDFVTLDTLFG